MLRIGHKGADAIVPGNTPESFAAAVEAGSDVIELDLLRPRRIVVLDKEALKSRI